MKSNIMIYTVPTCPWCKKTKAFLRKHRIRFKNLDVSKNKDKKREMVRKSGQEGVPVIDINGKIIVGYDEKEMKKLLRL